MEFHDWIAQHARGDLDNQMTEALNEVAGAVALLDKDGTVTLKLKVGKTGGRLIVAGKVETKAPEADPEAGLYFLGDDGLTKDDPFQMKWDLKSGVGDAPVRKVDTETGEVTE